LAQLVTGLVAIGESYQGLLVELSLIALSISAIRNRYGREIGDGQMFEEGVLSQIRIRDRSQKRIHSVKPMFFFGQQE
jgi:hypothetical protein